MPLKILNRLRRSFAFRLSLWYAAIFVLSFAVLSVVSYIFLSSSVRDNREIIQAKLRAFLTLAQEGGIPAIEREATVEQHPSRRTSFFVRVLDPRKRVVFFSNPWLWRKFDLRQSVDHPAEGQWEYFPAKKEGDVLEVTSTRMPDGNLLQVGMSLEDRREILQHFGDTIVSLMVPMILLSLAGGAFLAFRALQPIRDLIHAMQSIVGTGSMDARVPISKAGDELDELVQLFNQMLERIEGLIKGMREALDNVAHDLRTPITRLRGIAETNLGSDSDLEHCREALSDCLEESERVVTLLDALMDIAEAETRTMKLHLAPVNVASLIADVVDLYEDLAEDKGIALSVTCRNDICVMADGNRIRQVLANLLDNAIKYTPDPGKVTITAYQEASQAVIVVKDTGVGIPPEEISRIWDRLYRGDKSRSQRGLGLGLSLVKAVIQAHDGRVEVHSEPGAGSTFVLSFPTVPFSTVSSFPALNLSQL
jgi:heavy metal sensor kinase